MKLDLMTFFQDIIYLKQKMEHVLQISIPK